MKYSVQVVFENGRGNSCISEKIVFEGRGTLERTRRLRTMRATTGIRMVLINGCNTCGIQIQIQIQMQTQLLIQILVQI